MSENCTSTGRTLTSVFSIILMMPTLLALLSASSLIFNTGPNEESKTQGYTISYSFVSLWISLILIVAFMQKICDNVYLKWGILLLMIVLIITTFDYTFNPRPTTKKE